MQQSDRTSDILDSSGVSPVVVDILSPFPGEFIDPEKYGFKISTKVMYLLPHGDEMRNEVFAPIDSFLKTEHKSSIGSYLYFHSSRIQDLVIRINLDYEVSCADRSEEIFSGEIVGNAKIDVTNPGGKKVIAVSVWMDKKSVDDYCFVAAPDVGAFDEGEVIGKLVFYPNAGYDSLPKNNIDSKK